MALSVAYQYFLASHVDIKRLVSDPGTCDQFVQIRVAQALSFLLLLVDNITVIISGSFDDDFVVLDSTRKEPVLSLITDCPGSEMEYPGGNLQTEIQESQRQMLIPQVGTWNTLGRSDCLVEPKTSTSFSGPGIPTIPLCPSLPLSISPIIHPWGLGSFLCLDPESRQGCVEFLPTLFPPFLPLPPFCNSLMSALLSDFELLLT